MFKKLVTAFVAAAFALAAWAECPDTEVCVSYGALPAMRFVPAYYNHWNRMNPWGAVAVSVDHRFADRLWLGLSYTISSASAKDVSQGREGSIAWHSLMVHSRYEYWRRGAWSAYCSLGVGVLIAYMQPEWEPTYNRTMFAFQASPVGVAWQALPNLDFFGEAGFGVQGIVRAGVRVDF